MSFEPLALDSCPLSVDSCLLSLDLKPPSPFYLNNPHTDIGEVRRFDRLSFG